MNLVRFVGGAQCARYTVRKLMLDNFGRDTDLLMQDGARHRSEAVVRDLRLSVVAHAPQGSVLILSSFR